MIKFIIILFLCYNYLLAEMDIKPNFDKLSQSLIEKTQSNPKHIIFNDLRLPSSQKRMWVFDTKSKKILIHDYVTHGQGSGALLARHFSNTEGSHQSSSGVFRIENHYYGNHGYSLILNGLEKDINHLAKQRHIVIHGAGYASESFIKKYGRLGRSWGCPAVSLETLEKFKALIEPGDLLINITNESSWIQSTEMVDTTLFT
jgi:hypothetical protein